MIISQAQLTYLEKGEYTKLLNKYNCLMSFLSMVVIASYFQVYKFNKMLFKADVLIMIKVLKITMKLTKHQQI